MKCTGNTLDAAYPLLVTLLDIWWLVCGKGGSRQSVSCVPSEVPSRMYTSKTPLHEDLFGPHSDKHVLDLPINLSDHTLQMLYKVTVELTPKACWVVNGLGRCVAFPADSHLAAQKAHLKAKPISLRLHLHYSPLAAARSIQCRAMYGMYLTMYPCPSGVSLLYLSKPWLTAYSLLLTLYFLC